MDETEHNMGWAEVLVYAHSMGLDCFMSKVKASISSNVRLAFSLT